MRGLQRGGLVLALMLGACGGSDEDGSDFEVTSQTRIDEFAVVGTGAPVSAQVPISASQNQGRFQLTWSASAATSSGYNARVYASEDALLDAADIDFFSQNCGPSDTLYNCGNTGEFQCSFATDNSIGCDLGFGRRSLQPLLDTLPKSAFLLLQVCDALFTDCKVEAAAVIFQ